MKKTLLFFAILFATAFGYTAQAVESHTVACTAGNLATVAASYLTTVTNLTITGTIDARDFKTMRDAMPLLEVIDLSGSTVAAYTGTEGTAGYSRSYPANGVPQNAFYNPLTYVGKTSLKTFIYPSSVTFIESWGFTGCTGFTGSLIIPSTVTNIGISAFDGCKRFTGTLTIPSSVIGIANYAFQYCSGFTGLLTIPSTVTNIGNYAFSKCRVLFDVNMANPNYSSLDGVLFNKNKTTLIQCPNAKTGNYLIPSTVTKIENYAFADCNGLTGSLTIPSSVTTVGDYAFANCGGFTGTLTIPTSVTSIGIKVFYNCVNLTGSLTIPSSVTTIGNYAFIGCRSFKDSLTLPSSLTTIREGAFWGCSGLTSIYAYTSTPINIGASPDIFYLVNKISCILHVPVGSKGLYAAANQWKDFTNIVDDIVPAPQATSATAIANTSFIANWNNVPIADKYFLDVATDNTFTNMVAGYNNLDVSNVLSISITGLSAGTTYYYRVRTLCALGTSGNSNVISATIKKDQLITINTLANKKYGAAPFTVTASGGASGNPVTFSSSNDAVAKCSGTNGATITIVGAGTCNIKANQLGNGSYNNATQVSQSLTIDQAPLIVTANAKSKVYGTTNPTFDFTITGFVNGQTLATSDVTGAAYTSCSAYSTTPAGTAPIVVNLATLSSNNYTFTSANGLLTITKAPLTVKANDKSRIYGAENPLFDATITGFISGESLATSGVTGTASITCAANATTPSGTANIVPSIGSLASGNYSFNFVNGLLTISKLTQSISFGALAPYIYGAAPFTVSATGGASGSPVVFTSSNSAVATCTGTNGSTITIKGGGTCYIYANQASNSSYDSAPQVEQLLVVAKAPLVITANPKTKAFGTENPTFDVTMTNFKNGETLATSGIIGTVAINCSANTTTPVGKVDIIPSVGTLSSESYTFYFNNGLLTITPATALENIIAQNSITLYPNPASSSVKVSELSTLASDKDITLNITDISGNMLLIESIEPTLNSATIDVSSLSSGAYVMVIQSSKGNVVKRFLKR